MQILHFKFEQLNSYDIYTWNGCKVHYKEREAIIMLIYVVTRDGVVMHITTDFDEAEIVASGYVACAHDQVLEEKIVNEKDVTEVALLGWGNGVEIYEANTDDAVLDLDEANTDDAVLNLDAGIKITLREIREKLGAAIP